MITRPKFIMFLLLIVCLAFSITGCSQNIDGQTAASSHPRYGGALRLNLKAPVQTLDPAHIYDTSSLEVAKEIFNGLVSIDPETMKIVAAHAEKWESQEGRLYRFFLRKGTTFSNGQEVTAEDFKYSLERILDPAVASEISGMLLPIEGAQEKLAGKAKEVPGILVKDKYTLDIKLTDCYPNFINVLTHPGFAVIERGSVKKAGADFGTQAAVTNLVGSGPFQIKSWDNNQVELAANPNYYGGKPYLNQVVYRFIKEETTALNEFRAGNLDIVDALPPGQVEALKAEYSGQTITTNLLGVTFYLFNLEKEPFTNSDLRKAINYAVNRDDLVLALEGEAEKGTAFVPPGAGQVSGDFEKYNYNKKEAERLLAKAGYPKGKGLPEIELKFNTSEENQRVAEIVQANLRDIGIKVKLLSMEPAAFLEDISKGNSQIFRMSWVADYPDIDTFLAPLFTSAEIGNTNFAFYKNKEFDDSVARAGKTTDKKQQAALYSRAHQLLQQDSVAVILYYPAHTILISDKVQGLKVSKMDLKPLQKVWLNQ